MYCAEVLLANLSTENSEFKMLYQARMSFLLDRHLSSSVLHLKDASLNHYKTLIENLQSKLKEDNSNDELKKKLSLLLIEQSYC